MNKTSYSKCYSQALSERNVIEEMQSGVVIVPQASRTMRDVQPHVETLVSTPIRPTPTPLAATVSPSVIPTPASLNPPLDEQDGGDGLRRDPISSPRTQQISDEDYLDPDIDLDIEGMNLDDVGQLS